MTAMTLALFLSIFQPIPDSELTDYKSSELASIIQTLPAEQEIYTSLGEEAFHSLLVTRNDDLAFQRFVDLFRWLLYYDGRTESGFLRLAELAYENPHYAVEATNVLGALVSYYRSGGRPSMPPDTLIERFERYMKNPDLFHNARECRNALKAQMHALTPIRDPQ